jgi:serine phosphatase RsbU (regulator of sigma subunit)
VCSWLLTAPPRPDVPALDEVLASSPTVVMLLDASGAVGRLIPHDAVFLGRPPREYIGRTPPEVFGLSPGEPGSEALPGRLRVALDADGREVPVLVSRAPGESALVLTVVEELSGLRAKNQRMADIQHNLTRQRQTELEAANELYQKQALELKRVLGELENRNQKIVEELELAGELQKSLLPREFPRDVALEFSHKYLPASYVSGDFFDVIPLGKGRAGIIVADVSGHGVAPAFLTTMFKGIFKANAAECDSPATVMTRVNREMCSALRSEHYLTAFYAIVDTERMECRYSNAGHPRQLILRTDGAAEEITSEGFFIGMFEGTEYGEETSPLDPGDKLLLYTDGVIEVANVRGEQFGRDGILRVAAEHAEAGPEELSAALFQELLSHLGEASFPDDVTILVAQVLGSI